MKAVVKVVLALFVFLALSCGQCAAELAGPPAPYPLDWPAMAMPPEPVAKPAAKPAARPAVTAAKAARPVWRTEVGFSGKTSELSDQLSGSINLNRSLGPRKWWVKAGYDLNKSRTYGKDKVNETDIITLTMDTQYRLEAENNYRFMSGTANVKTWTGARNNKSGYYMFSAGYGKTVLPGLEAELALADITRYDDGTEHMVSPVYSLRLKTGLTDSMTLDSDTHFVKPWSDSSLVDSRVNLTYKFTPTLSMRLTYIANNMLSPLLSKTGWDKSYRIALVFSRSSR